MESIIIIVCYTIVTLYILFKGGDHNLAYSSLASIIAVVLAKRFKDSFSFKKKSKTREK